MNETTKTIAGAIAGGALLATVLAIWGTGSPDAVGLEVASFDYATSKVVFVDGGKFYYVPVVLVDGGSGAVLLAQAPCKRRPIDAGIDGCVRAPDGGVAPLLARYPAQELTGSECEEVACSVWQGVDADGPEVAP